MIKFFEKLTGPIFTKMIKDFISYIFIVDKCQIIDPRERKYYNFNMLFLKAMFFVVVLVLNSYFYALLNTFPELISGNFLIYIQAVIFFISLFGVKFYIYDNNTFASDLDMNKYANYEKKIFSCPMGFINNAKKLKIVYYKAHPFYKMEKNFKDEYDSVSASYLNDKQMKIFYKTGYTWIMEIEFVTAVRSMLIILLFMETTMLLMDFFTTFSITHYSSHILNIKWFIFFFSIHTIFYFTMNGKNSKKERFIKLSKNIRRLLNKNSLQVSNG